MPATGEDIVGEWLALAEEDYNVACRVIDVTGPAAFHLQQAAEKALKAAIIRGNVRPPRSHDLTKLRAVAGDALAWTADDEFLAALTSWNVAFRYVDEDPADRPDKEALTRAAVIVKTLLDEVRGGGPDKTPVR